MEEYQKGQVVYYTEDGDVLKVRILDNSSDDEILRYKLETLEVIKTGPRSGVFYQSMTPGKIFDCNKQRGLSPMFEMWELSDVVESS